MSLLFGYLPSGVVLNVGSGSTDGASAGPDRQVVGFDLVRPAGPNSRFAVADVAALPVRPGSADGVLAKDVIEHVDDVASALGEIRAALRPGGTLVVTVPRAIARAVWDDYTHRRGFTERALRAALTEAGFDPLELCRIGPVPGIGRLGLERHLPAILRVPGVGHWFGTNWLCVARARAAPQSGGTRARAAPQSGATRARAAGST